MSEAETVHSRRYRCRIDGLVFLDLKAAVAHLRMRHAIKEYDEVLMAEFDATGTEQGLGGYEGTRYAA
jgi:hypothetical protein